MGLAFTLQTLDAMTNFNILWPSTKQFSPNSTHGCLIQYTVFGELNKTTQIFQFQHIILLNCCMMKLVCFEIGEPFYCNVCDIWLLFTMSAMSIIVINSFVNLTSESYFRVKREGVLTGSSVVRSFGVLKMADRKYLLYCLWAEREWKPSFYQLKKVMGGWVVVVGGTKMFQTINFIA